MEIPLTTFLDYVLKSGSPKMTCVKKIKSQLSEPYDPVFDYYKRFREAVQEMHRNKINKTELSKLIGPLPGSKTENYKVMIAGYKKFLGNKSISCFNPPREKWTHGKLEIAINPELGLEWNNKQYVIKLYLKAEPITKDRMGSILALMHTTLAIDSYEYALLDMRTSKLHLFDTNMLTLISLIEGEAQSLEFILNKL